MSGLNTPTATVLVQRAKSYIAKGANPDENALLFEYGDGPGQAYFEGTIQYLIAQEGSSGICTIDIYNVDRTVLEQFEPHGIVQVIAGYTNIPGMEPRPIFTGTLFYAYSYLRGAEIIARIVATTTPNRFAHVVPTVNIPKGTNYADAIDAILEPLGGQLMDVAARAREFTLDSDYTCKMPAQEEIKILLDECSKKSGINFLFGPIPAVNFGFFLMDPNEYQQLDLVVGQDTIFNAGPIPMQGQVGGSFGQSALDATTGAIQEQIPTSPDAQVVQFDYQVNLPLDPRIIPTMVVKVTGSVLGDGIFLVMDLTHQFGGNEWGTDLKGPATGGNFFVGAV